MATVNLTDFDGLDIKNICGNGYDSPTENHCAHFVCHALDLDFGYTCKKAKGGLSSAANLRVHELFAKCPKVGKWADKPAGVVLAFVTAAGNVQLAAHTMSNVPNKHVGIFCNLYIWNYHNAFDKVAKETVGAFESRFKVAYGKSAALFFGTLPTGSNTVTAAAAGA
jgi:hypothetical protein